MNVSKSPSPGSRLEIDYDALRRQLSRSVSRVCPSWLADREDDIIQMALLRVMEIVRKDEHNPVPPASYLWRVAFIEDLRMWRADAGFPGRHFGFLLLPGLRTLSGSHRGRGLREGP